jgi:AAA domain-containing protein
MVLVRSPLQLPDAQDWHAIAAEADAAYAVAKSKLNVMPWYWPLSHPSPAWLLPGILQTSSLHVLSSSTGCCKTWLALSTFLSGIHGTPVLGINPARPFNSIYLAADSTTWDIGGQMRALLYSNGITPAAADGPSFILPAGLLLDSKEHLDVLSDLITAFSIDALFIDVLLYAHSGDENDNSYMARTVLRNCKFLRDRFGLAIFLLHHNGNPRLGEEPRARGASTIIQAVEHHLTLRKRSDIITLEVAKCRGVPSFTTLDFSLATIGTEGKFLKLREHQLRDDAVLAALPATRASLGVTFAAPGRWLDNALQRLRQEGKAITDGKGNWQCSPSPP